VVQVVICWLLCQQVWFTLSYAVNSHFNGTGMLEDENVVFLAASRAFDANDHGVLVCLAAQVGGGTCSVCGVIRYSLCRMTLASCCILD